MKIRAMWITFIFVLCCVLLTLSSAKSKNKNDKTCSPFPYALLENGQIRYVGNQKYTFSCDPGYLLTSPGQVRCWKGQWSSTKEPKCTKAEGLCSDPEPVESGQIIGDDRKVGSAIQYLCNPGYLLMGQSSRHCLPSGHWNGIAPTCMEESEPVQKVAERLRSKFVTEMESFSTSGARAEGRLLDPDSVMHGLELVILLDRSSSVDPKDFKIGINFIKFLLQEFGVRNTNNPTGTRAAVIAFGTKVDILFNLDNATITGPAGASFALDTLNAGGGGTAMMEALVDVSTRLADMRPDAKKAIFMITDGEPNIGSVEDTIQLANQLREREGFEMFTVGIGRGINRQVLSKLASEPLINHVFILDSYSDLRAVMETIKERPTRPQSISPSRCGFVKQERNYLKLWPWLAALYMGLPDGSGAPRLGFCAGTLICSDWVLTAASCLHYIREINDTEREVQTITQEVFVSLGERIVTHEDRNQMNFYADRVVIHPDFQALNSLQNNLALIKLNEPAPMRRFRPACLPPTDRPVLLYEVLNMNTSIAGWGLPPSSTGDRVISGGTVQLHSSNVTVMLEEEDECLKVSGEAADAGVFCAGGIGMQTCIGDEGSPLIAVDSSTGLHHLIGVLSGRSSCAQGINQYTDMSRYTQWISDVTEQCVKNHYML